MGCRNTGSVSVCYDGKRYGSLEVDSKVRKALLDADILDLLNGELKYEGWDGVVWHGPANLELRFGDFYSYDMVHILTEIQKKLDPTRRGIWLDGKIPYDDETNGEEGFIDVTKGVASDHFKSEEDLFYATDAQLAAILRKRGYTVTKNRKGKKWNTSKRLCVSV